MLSLNNKSNSKSSRDLSLHSWEKIWSTIVPKTVLVVSGKVRLREEGADKPLAATGDWFGDLLEISGQFKAVASSKVVVRWDAALWTEASCLEM